MGTPMAMSYACMTSAPPAPPPPPPPHAPPAPPPPPPLPAVSLDNWAQGVLATPDAVQHKVWFRSVCEDASKVAEALGVKADVKHGATVQKVGAIHYVDEGRTELKQLWNMGSFAFALAGGRWTEPFNANKAVKNDPDLKKYDSRIIIETQELRVFLLNILYQSILFVRSFRSGRSVQMPSVVLNLVPLN